MHYFSLKMRFTDDSLDGFTMIGSYYSSMILLNSGFKRTLFWEVPGNHRTALFRKVFANFHSECSVDACNSFLYS